MKVFLSWSGDKSHKIAIVFRDWLSSVIQTIEPYVSSEDIDKGARWSSDIAKELENSSFGILCVTRDNITAPWLTFEAGALSKTMDKTFVSPFLFDIKRSEVDGPILQFQSTIFSKSEIYKLLKTINKACDKEQLTDKNLEKAFNVWYPMLEKQLNDIKNIPNEGKDSRSNNATIDINIIEEVLHLARLNQKLLRNPVNSINNDIVKINDKLDKVIYKDEQYKDLNNKYVDIENKYKELEKKTLITPKIYRNFEEVHPALESILDELIEANDAQSEVLKIRVLGVCFHKSFPFIKDYIVEKSSSGRRIELRLSKLDRKFIEENVFDKVWSSHYKVFDDLFEESKNNIYKIKQANVSLKLSKYLYMPNWHGVMVNKKHLFLSACVWNSEQCMTAGQNHYVYYKKEASWLDNQKILQFRRWFDYGRYNGTVKQNKQLIFDTNKSIKHHL